MIEAERCIGAEETFCAQHTFRTKTPLQHPCNTLLSKYGQHLYSTQTSPSHLQFGLDYEGHTWSCRAMPPTPQEMREDTAIKLQLSPNKAPRRKPPQPSPIFGVDTLCAKLLQAP